MIIRKVTVGELTDFVESDEYRSLNPKPITPLRAISQAKNPAARAEDVALVYFAKGNNLIAFAGLLPDAASEINTPIYSNSGWWIHKEWGRKYGLQIFLKAFQASHKRMFFTDCSEYTKSVLERTGLFCFNPPDTGVRFIIRFYLGGLSRRKGMNRFLQFILFKVDLLFNFLLSFLRNAWLKRNGPEHFNWYSLNTIDKKLEAFIKDHSSDYYLKQSSEKLNWIINNPWIGTKEQTMPVSYPFSNEVSSFRQEFIVVEKDLDVVAVFFLSIRDNHATIPYLYYEKKVLPNVLKCIVELLIQNEVNSLTVFQSEIREALQKIKFPFVIRQRIVKYSGYSKELDGEFSKKMNFQDGEGDMAFT